MVQWVKTTATKSVYFNWVPKTYMVKRKKLAPPCSPLTSTYMQTHVHIHTGKQIHAVKM